MSRKLWLGRRFQQNERGHYSATGDYGAERVVVEIDPAVIARFPDEQPRSLLERMHARIQSAARQKWDAGEAFPVDRPGRTGPGYKLIALTDADLSLRD